MSQFELFEQEVWVAVKGYEGLYEISNFGKVKSLPRTRKAGKNRIAHMKEKILKHCLHHTGYFLVTLSIPEHGWKHHSVHRLLALNFLPNPKNLACVNHINEVRSDNRLENLEWTTYRENSCYSKGRNKTYSSKYIGVNFNKRNKNWIAYYKIKDVMYYIGAFKTEYDAALAYNTALEKLGIENKYKNKVA